MIQTCRRKKGIGILGRAAGSLLVALAAAGCGAPPPSTPVTSAASPAAELPPAPPPSAAEPSGAPPVRCEPPLTPAQNLAREADRRVPTDLKGAIARYEEATKLDPADHRIVFKLAMALKKSDQWADVASTMRRATALAPKFATYWVELGYALAALAKRKAGPGAASHVRHR